MSRVLIVGQAPGRPETNGGSRAEWAIFLRLEEWFTRAGFRPGAAIAADFVNACEGPEILEQAVTVAGRRLVATLGRVALTAVVGSVSCDFVGDAGSVFMDQWHAVPVLPLPHPSGRNRLFNDQTGRDALAVDLWALSRVRERLGLEEEEPR